MKTIRLEKPFNLSLSDSPFPSEIGADEALVKVHKVGICGTDLHAFKGLQNFFSYPRVLGHELAVEVLALGKDAAISGVSVGDYAAVNPYLSDGSCVACRRGKSNCCANMRVLGVHIDGGMREAFTVPAANLIKANLNLSQLAQVEMLAIGAHAVRRSSLENSENVVVIGAGPIGLGTLAFAQLKAKHIFMVDISQERLDFVERLGLAEVISAKEDVAAVLKDKLGGDLPTAVFDATGHAGSMMNAVNYVAHGGQLIFVGHTKNELSFDNPTLHSRELSIHCSRNATQEDFRTVIAALESGVIDVEAWITHRAGPEALITEFDSWTKPETGVVKGLLEFS